MEEQRHKRVMAPGWRITQTSRLQYVSDIFTLKMSRGGHLHDKARNDEASFWRRYFCFDDFSNDECIYKQNNMISYWFTSHWKCCHLKAVREVLKSRPLYGDQGCSGVGTLWYQYLLRHETSGCKISSERLATLIFKFWVCSEEVTTNLWDFQGMSGAQIWLIGSIPFFKNIMACKLDCPFGWYLIRVLILQHS